MLFILGFGLGIMAVGFAILIYLTVRFIIDQEIFNRRR